MGQAYGVSADIFIDPGKQTSPSQLASGGCITVD
jgi:hypothetical protein